MSSTYALEVQGLAAAYERSPIIYDIHFSVPSGRIVGIVGPNGAGKSTMLKAILGMIPKTQGTVRVYGEAIAKAMSRIGYMPQRESIDWDFPVTVWDVVMMGCYGRLGLVARPGEEEKDCVSDCLKRVHLSDFAERPIGNLSVGQQQRVFLARALAQQSDLYFMDEPFAGVDAKTESAIVEVLREMKSKNKSILVIHHDLSTVEDYFDDVLLLNRQVVAYGSTNEVFNIENLERAYEGNLHVFKVKS